MPDVKPRPERLKDHPRPKPKDAKTQRLTPMQRDFVMHLAMGESVPTATLRAGFEVALYGYQMIKTPHIKAAWEEEKRKYEEASNMTRAKVMQQFAEAYDMAKLVADPHAMVSATKEAAKMLGYYEPVRRQVNITVNGNGRSRELAVMSNEELAKLVDDSTSEGFATDLRGVIGEALDEDGDKDA